ncbi:hypothetical protein [Deinococcus soli (ex Cha et al. 2016)]|uniref:Uncharacterized protein n=2 Tax=Deinococcus soli (ex Cha et al. 2016) TaxID=1309411 RepID=A0ACC6KFL2_9DEIO|nr:hypothetical protein [Deinococcus soli (ex Cha et al. 2016)]MDR6218327.1 hypothetical protein [Deinococcus soli (ex Cha et al. 2016)]MDR6329067.1 hypothetical protein [Deinococcus soli (ex Cha et al. 2016)]MDR6751340.1 hypothetical protein [Deinococcus soli (ex Cha et al. 2016)]
MTTTIWTEYAALMPERHRPDWTEYLQDLKTNGARPSHVRTFQLPLPTGATAALLTRPGGRLYLWRCQDLASLTLTLRGPQGDTLLTSHRRDELGYIVASLDEPAQWVIDGAQPLGHAQADATQLEQWTQQAIRNERTDHVKTVISMTITVAFALSVLAFVIWMVWLLPLYDGQAPRPAPAQAAAAHARPA